MTISGAIIPAAFGISVDGVSARKSNRTWEVFLSVKGADEFIGRGATQDEAIRDAIINILMNGPRHGVEAES